MMRRVRRICEVVEKETVFAMCHEFVPESCFPCSFFLSRSFVLKKIDWWHLLLHPVCNNEVRK
jgi:hypothetical protein